MSGRLAALWDRLKGRPDTEHEQAIIRVAVGAVLLVYMLPKVLIDGAAQAADLGFWGGVVVFFGGSLVILADILRRPAISVSRRLVGMVADTGGCTWYMWVAGDYGFAVIGIYLFTSVTGGVSLFYTRNSFKKVTGMQMMSLKFGQKGRYEQP